jgi:HopA1 effector protein family
MSVGNKRFCHPQPGNVLVRIYFNLTLDGLVAVMESLAKGLNEIGIPFSFISFV